MKIKGLSPVVATVLLIAMVVVIAMIVFLWLGSITEEKITKFDGRNVKVICGDVNFDASYSGGKLFVSNTGNVPIYGMKLKVSKDRGHNTLNLDQFKGLNQGGAFSGDISSQIVGAKKITLIPILLGSSDQGEKTYTCDDDQYGYELVV